MICRSHNLIQVTERFFFVCQCYLPQNDKFGDFGSISWHNGLCSFMNTIANCALKITRADCTSREIDQWYAQDNCLETFTLNNFTVFREIFQHKLNRIAITPEILISFDTQNCDEWTGKKFFCASGFFGSCFHFCFFLYWYLTALCLASSIRSDSTRFISARGTQSRRKYAYR